MFGGNSNWRGPVWMPLNYLAIRQFVNADRLLSIWTRDDHGRRPDYGEVARLQEDPAWKDNLLFFAYFNGDDGAGLGAMHQTGWTALVVDLILDPPAAQADAGPGRTDSAASHHH